MSLIIDKALEVIDTEIQGLHDLKEQLDQDFEKMVETCISVLDNGGKIVLCGVGKSGHIGKKLAATLSSIGSTAVFMHPIEALHGDLGVLNERDVLLALSYSGETDELLSIFPAAKLLGVPIIALTGNADSRLSELSDLTIQMKIHKEACPFNLVPTTSTTALLALGDALAIVLLKVRGFTKENFGRLHPAGAIGRAVTLRIKDLMRTGERLPLVKEETEIKEVLYAMTQARCGCAIVVDKDTKLKGIFTDGDFRRHIEDDMNILKQAVSTVMTENPASINQNSLAVEVLKMVESKNINDVIAIDDNGCVVGVVDIQDLPGMKLM